MLKKIVIIVTIIIVVILLIIISTNLIVILSTKNQIDNNNGYDAILVLGAGVWGDSPSPMLQERLDKAIELYKAGVSKKIIMSGDHGTKEYDEVNIMKSYAIDNGVPSEDIFMDHAGFSTYDSIYRAREIFGVNKVLIVTQKYHLYRALYISNKLKMEVDGVDAMKVRYSGQIVRDAREVLARTKDFAICIIKPKPKYLGGKIDITGSGDITNDK